MAKINLLPWRAERRKQRQKEFYTMLGGTALVAVVIAFGVVKFYDGLLAGQEDKNAYLKEEIAALDLQIKEIEALDKKKAELLARARQSGTLSLALRSITDVNAAEDRSSGQVQKRNESVNVVRYGVANQTTAQK